MHLDQPGTILLDTARTDDEHVRSLLFTDPAAILRADRLEEVSQLLTQLDQAVKDGYHVAGYLAYEAGYAFEEIALDPAVPCPLGWFGVYEAPQTLDAVQLSRLIEQDTSASFDIENVRLGISREAYLNAITSIKSYIWEGDVYQINFTDKIAFDFKGSALALYRHLRQRQSVFYGALLNTGETHVLSLSPELFFRREGRHIEARPMKGTVHRGRTYAEDRTLAHWLANDAKSQAENVMIVDLLRNDLSLCCEPGSVVVPALYSTEVYETVIQMTSTVQGVLKPETSYSDLFKSLFPCGSVTGAPKIRAMQCIHELEAGPRGVYCGAIGHIGPNDRAEFNVAIRTVVLQAGEGEMGTGSGVVWDSNTQAEYEECLLKTQFLTGTVSTRSEEFELIETMRAEGTSIPLLDLHLRRLQASAAYFDFSFDEVRFRRTIADRLTSVSEDEQVRVRVTLNRGGEVALTTAPLGERLSAFSRVMLAGQRVDSADVFLFHKTTRRTRYEMAYRQAQEAGYDEVLFLNERGEITEGSRTNLFAIIDERWVTPPQTAGLLGGVFRQHVLETVPNVEERVLTVRELQEADAVYLCNAVHGLVPVESIDGAGTWERSLSNRSDWLSPKGTAKKRFVS